MENIINSLKIFNGELNDILSKKHNIWLGVSISLKPYSEKLAQQYLKLIIKYSKDSALVFVGDEIASINYNVLQNYSQETSLKKAMAKGDFFVNKYSKLVKTLSPEDQKKIKIVRWADVWTEKTEKFYDILKEEYLTNLVFKKEVDVPIISFLKNSQRTVKDSRVAKMSEYILKELPFLLDGVGYEQIKYNLLVYPTYSKVSLGELSSKIQKGEKYADLKKKLNLKGDHILTDSPILE